MYLFEILPFYLHLSPHWARGQHVWLLIEVVGSIPITHNFKCGLGLERGPLSLVRTIGKILDWEVVDLIKEVSIIRLDGA